MMRSKEKLLKQIDEFLKTAKFLKLTSDVVFKAFFKENIDLLNSLLIHFLPLPEGSVIEEIAILNPELHPKKLSLIGIKSGKDFVLDLRVRFKRILPDDSHFMETVNVEIQTVSKTYLMDRNLVYISRLLSDQLQKGKGYGELSKVYSLLFIVGALKEFESVNDYYHVCSLLRTKPPHVLMSQLIHFVIVELGKFAKDSKTLYNVRDSWCYLLKNSNKMNRLEYKGLLNQGGDMTKAVNQLWNLSQDEALREYTRALEKQEMDRISDKDEAFKEGRQEGVKEVVLKFLNAGMSVEKVSQISGLSKTEIHNFQEKSKE